MVEGLFLVGARGLRLLCRPWKSSWVLFWGIFLVAWGGRLLRRVDSGLAVGVVEGCRCIVGIRGGWRMWRHGER